MTPVAKIKMEQELMEEKTRQTIGAVQDEAHLAREKTLSDAVYYKQVKSSSVYATKEPNICAS